MLKYDGKVKYRRFRTKSRRLIGLYVFKFHAFRFQSATSDKSTVAIIAVNFIQKSLIYHDSLAGLFNIFITIISNAFYAEFIAAAKLAYRANSRQHCYWYRRFLKWRFMYRHGMSAIYLPYAALSLLLIWRGSPNSYLYIFYRDMALSWVGRIYLRLPQKRASRQYITPSCQLPMPLTIKIFGHTACCDARW